MKYVIINDKKFDLLENYKEGFDLDQTAIKLTDYFDLYDYIVGDWAYGKLRLKGFCKQGNKLYKEINDFDKVKEYVKNQCAHDCRYFILEQLGSI